MLEDEDYYWYVTEFLAGGDLGQKLAKLKKFDENSSLKVLYQIILGIFYLHSHDIIHRDLKPANVLLEDYDKWGIKIADFGLSE